MADEYPRITNKRLLEMLDDQGKIYQRFKEKKKLKEIKELKKGITELIEDEDKEGKGPVGQRFKEITKPKKARQKPLDMKSGGLAKRGYGKARR
jgi:hypothetical protein|tara:strand:+ start:51 stop:332 length:282 start_codon:yes stop_codon:yes gene_type:complete